jgi:phosphoribosylamine--glycine ligase
VDGLVAFAKTMAVDLVVVGPEAPLVAGLGDALRAAGVRCFGPDADGARLEGSKAWAKDLMVRNNVPTAGHRVFASIDDARAYCTETETYPLVVKADGLAGGKGVSVCYSRDEAFRALAEAMEQKKFGDAGATVVIEEFLRGEEVSVHAITDGDTLLVLPSAQDHKRLNDDDGGPNTGGMGAYSPAPVLTDRLLDAVVRTVLVPILHALKREGVGFRGVLYAGLMVTRSGPKVLEWNVRFGDPETQVLLPRIRTDLAAVFAAAADGTLDELEDVANGLDEDPRPVVGVVMASEGYPEAYKTGKEIRGLAEAAAVDGVVVYHSGTRSKDGGVLTAGGRVLTVTAIGDDVADARAKAYRGVAAISWDGEHHRTDIAVRALPGARAAR